MGIKWQEKILLNSQLNSVVNHKLPPKQFFTHREQPVHAKLKIILILVEPLLSFRDGFDPVNFQTKTQLK